MSRYFHGGYFRAFSVSHIPVLIHWAPLSILALLLLLAFENISLFLAYLSVVFLVLIHELGHAGVARKLGHYCEFITINVVYGRCHIKMERLSSYDEALISWGGLLAQLIIFVPSLIFFSLLGYSSIEPINALIFVLVFMNGASIAFNLIPASPIDGAMAWKAVPVIYRTKVWPYIKSIFNRKRKNKKKHLKLIK